MFMMVSLVLDWFAYCVTRQRLYTWVFYNWWAQREKHKDHMLSERLVGKNQMKTFLTACHWCQAFIITLSGSFAWRTESLAESLEMLEGEDKWKRETNCFHPDVPWHTTLHDSNHMERHQHWTTRQVKLNFERRLVNLFYLIIIFKTLFSCQEMSGAGLFYSGWPTCQEMCCGQMQTGDSAKRHFTIL